MQFASLSIVCGGAVFWRLAPDAAGDLVATGALAATILLLRVASLVAALSGVAWLAGTIAYATGGFASLSDPTVLQIFFFQTPFGGPALLRLVLLATLVPIAVARFGDRARLSAMNLVGGALLVSQAWLGHADDGGDTPFGAAMITTYAVHVVAMAVWVGALPPLYFLVVRARRRGTATGATLDAFLRRTSNVATVAVVLIVGSGTANTIFHDGGRLANLAFTNYGRILLAKVSLVAFMLAIAALNRFALMPRLRQGGAGQTTSMRYLQFGLAVDLVIGLLVLGAAALLGITPPPR